MATSTVKKVCATCRKGGDVFTCRGCRRSFCAEHVDEHRAKLTKEVERLAEQHESLQREINRDSEAQLLLSVINTWQQEATAKITLAAETARTDLEKWIERNNLEIKIPFERITNELRACQQADDYTEIDLKRWMQQLEEYRNKLERLPIIDSTDEDDMDKIHLIKLIDPRGKIEANPIAQSNGTFERISITSDEPILLVRERFEDVSGGATISEDGLKVAYTGAWLGDSNALGVNLYSSGTHHIRFRILEKFYDSPFFGIITASQKNVEHILDTMSVNGWRNFDFPIANGEKDVHIGRDKVTRQLDELTLILDCERKQIFLQHHRTKRLLHLPVDLRNCPFPWRMLVVLHRRGDSVRIAGGTLSLTRENLSSRLSEKRRT